MVVLEIFGGIVILMLLAVILDAAVAKGLIKMFRS